MALKIRLTRVGTTHQPHYRVVVAEARSRRDGDPVESIGTYDPRAEKVQDKTVIKRDRVIFWLDRGAKPTLTVRNILMNTGIHTKT